MTAPRVRRATPADGEQLREVMAAAKASWGYDGGVVAEWAAAEDFSEARFGGREIYAAEADDGIVAWFAVAPSVTGTCLLDDLWVAPPAMGAGLGRRLFERAVARARDLGCRALEWEADPYAVPFYERMGARVVGETHGSWGRPLPVMRVELG